MKIFIVLASVLSVGLCQLAGGLMDQPSTAFPEYRQKIISVMPYLGASSDLQVLRVQTQVVAGLKSIVTLLYNGGICEVDVYERPWEHFRSVTKNTCRTTKRQLGGLFGGWRPVQNQNDPIVQKAIAMVIDRVNAMSNNMYRMVESRILSLEQQVVAGTNYRMSMLLGESSCINSVANMGLLAVACPVNLNSVLTAPQVNATVYRHLNDMMEITAFKLVQRKLH